MIATAKKLTSAGEHQAVDEDHHAGALQVLHLRHLDLAVDLRQRLLAAHRQNRVAEADEDRDRGERRPDRPLQPAERVVGELDVAARRQRRQRPAAVHQRQRAPGDQQHDHHGGDLHDRHRIVAALVDAARVAPPEVDGDQDGDEGRRRLRRDPRVRAGARQDVVDQAGDVAAGRHAADRAGQDVVEQQRRDRQLRERAAHRLLDDAVDAAADEHRGALDVERAHGVGEDHHAEDEPRRRLADRLLDDAADVERGGSEIGEDDRRGAPERDEREKNGGGDDDADAAVARQRGGGHSGLPSERRRG